MLERIAGRDQLRSINQRPERNTMRSEYPNQRQCEDMLLVLLRVCGGEACALFSHETYEPLADVFGLTVTQRTITRDDASGRYEGRSEPHWHNIIQFARRRLRDMRYLDRSPRTVWMLSAKGRERANWLLRAISPDLVALMKAHRFTPVSLGIRLQPAPDVRTVEF